MRTAFLDELTNIARVRPEIFLVVGDVGFSVVEPFADEFPDRFLNAGIAEQNMTGLAAGLASEGYHVFTYSIANFPTLRCIEQVRNDVCYHNFSVCIVAVGAGMSYGTLGYSHHCVQDIACLRGMPNITLLSPGDPGETRASVKWIAENPGPSYLRLGKAGEPNLHSIETNVVRNVKVAARRGAGIAIVATGSVLAEAIRAGDLLSEKGIKCDVFSCIRLAPLDTEQFSELNGYETVLSVEEHVGPGGLGELLSGQLRGGTRLVSRHVGPEIASKVGSQQALRVAAGLDAESLIKALN